MSSCSHNCVFPQASLKNTTARSLGSRAQRNSDA
uniref:Uncharacterized protein n=1 Tax=Anguilla anguilla TaxID=7936 RepID=A0A0E9U595_ANGAN